MMNETKKKIRALSVANIVLLLGFVQYLRDNLGPEWKTTWSYRKKQALDAWATFPTGNLSLKVSPFILK
jgi:hypothetical protein